MKTLLAMLLVLTGLQVFAQERANAIVELNETMLGNYSIESVICKGNTSNISRFKTFMQDAQIATIELYKHDEIEIYDVTISRNFEERDGKIHSWNGISYTFGEDNSDRTTNLYKSEAVNKYHLELARKSWKCEFSITKL